MTALSNDSRRQVPVPSARALDVIDAALKAEMSAYVRSGGSRNFRHEDAQDEARRWLDAARRAARV